MLKVKYKNNRSQTMSNTLGILKLTQEVGLNKSILIQHEKSVR